jgi:hypothetical protein
MGCRMRLLLECTCHPIRYSVAICLRICQIRPKGPFISQGLSDIVSAYVYPPLAVVSAYASAIYHERLAEHFRIFLCIWSLQEKPVLDGFSVCHSTVRSRKMRN